MQEDESCLPLFCFRSLAKALWFAILGIKEDSWHAVADSTYLFNKIIEYFLEHNANHSYFLLLSMFVIDALWNGRNLCRVLNRKKKVEDTLAFPSSFLDGSRPYLYPNNVLDKNIMTANVILHIDGSFIEYGKITRWTFTLFNNRRDYLWRQQGNG